MISRFASLLWQVGKLFVAGLVVWFCLVATTHAQQDPAIPRERRIALVLGNAAYAEGALVASANDAGLVAQTLQAAGFDVLGARDLDGDGMRRAARDFLDKATQSGPDTVAAFYFAGYGVQFEGENYLVPIDARIARAADVPIQAFRVADLLRPLASIPLKARIVVLDAARASPFARSGPPLAGGLSLTDPDPGMLLAFNAAPGTVAPDSKDTYGAYAKALSEMIREGGLPLDALFDRVRLRTSELTQGAVVPWDVNRVTGPFVFLERASDAPGRAADENYSALQSRPIQDLDPREAYQAALQRDSIQGYQDFLAVFPHDPLARRVRGLLAARREAVFWRRTWQDGSPRAYWTYLSRYPHGPHAAEADRRLERLSAALQPPADFVVLDYDVPPPPPDEFVFFDRPVLMFADPVYDLPPPPPLIYLEPIPTYFVDLPPPPPPVDVFVLPQPVYEPVPIWVNRPTYVAPPPVNLITYNIHNTVIVNPTANTVAVRTPAGQPVDPLAGAVAAGIVPRAALTPSVPAPSAAVVPTAPIGGAPAPANQPGLSAGTAGVAGAALGAGAATALSVALPPSVAARARASQPAATSLNTAVPVPSTPAPSNASGTNAGRPGAPGVQGIRTPAGATPLPGVAPAVPGRTLSGAPGPAAPQRVAPQVPAALTAPALVAPQVTGPAAAPARGGRLAAPAAPGPIATGGGPGPAPGGPAGRPARAAPALSPAGVQPSAPPNLRESRPGGAGRVPSRAAPGPVPPAGSAPAPAPVRTPPSGPAPRFQAAPTPARAAPPPAMRAPPRAVPPIARPAPPPQPQVTRPAPAWVPQVARPAPAGAPPAMRAPAAPPVVRAPSPPAGTPRGAPPGKPACGGHGQPACR